ncbi:hypothetical protein LZ31DRAFT_49646 [Colletotrichum somersetense]|nr:hypothetical protein LZ31DRAFT_49646 [Colletotrichum somersetense]
MLASLKSARQLSEVSAVVAWTTLYKLSRDERSLLFSMLSTIRRPRGSARIVCRLLDRIPPRLLPVSGLVYNSLTDFIFLVPSPPPPLVADIVADEGVRASASFFCLPPWSPHRIVRGGTVSRVAQESRDAHHLPSVTFSVAYRLGRLTRRQPEPRDHRGRARFPCACLRAMTAGGTSCDRWSCLGTM